MALLIAFPGLGARVPSVCLNINGAFFFFSNVRTKLALSEPSLMSHWAGKGDRKMSAPGSDGPELGRLNFPTLALGFQKSLTFQCG